MRATTIAVVVVTVMSVLIGQVRANDFMHAYYFSTTHDGNMINESDGRICVSVYYAGRADDDPRKSYPSYSYPVTVTITHDGYTADADGMMCVTSSLVITILTFL